MTHIRVDKANRTGNGFEERVGGNLQPVRLFSQILRVGCVWICGGLLAQAGITTLNLNPTTYELIGLNVDQSGTSFTYSPSDFVGLNLTAWDGDSGFAMLVEDNAGDPGDGNRAALLDTDLRFDTGIINPGGAFDAVRIDFASPVENIDGDEVFLFDVESDGTRDSVRMRINGVDVTYGAADYTGQLWGGIPQDVWQRTATPNTLAELESGSWSKGADATFNIFGLAVDLSDHGVPLGGTVNFIEFGGIPGGNNVDPVFIGGLDSSTGPSGQLTTPEPETGMFILFGLGMICFYRRSLATARREKATTGQA